MKRKTIRVLSAALMPVLLAAGGCGSPAYTANPPGDGTGLPRETAAADTFPLPDDRSAMYEAVISSLEERLLREKTDRYLSEGEYENTIEALREKLDSLQGDARSASADPAPYETGHVPTNAPPEPVHIAEKDTEAVRPATSPASLRYGIVNGEAVIYAFLGGSPDLVIPDTLDGFPVTVIADDAVRGAGITSVILPDTVREIGWFAFSDCPGLRTAVLPASLASVGYEAFSGCPALTVVCAPDTYAAAWAESYGIPVSAPGA